MALYTLKFVKRSDALIGGSEVIGTVQLEAADPLEAARKGALERFPTESDGALLMDAEGGIANIPMPRA